MKRKEEKKSLHLVVNEKGEKGRGGFRGPVSP